MSCNSKIVTGQNSTQMQRMLYHTMCLRNGVSVFSLFVLLILTMLLVEKLPDGCKPVSFNSSRRWYSKHQNIVEASTFSLEFCALKTAINMIEGLRYKVQLIGIPVNGPTSLFCDNESVVKNSTAMELTLKKCYSSIAYH